MKNAYHGGTVHGRRLEFQIVGWQTRYAVRLIDNHGKINRSATFIQGEQSHHNRKVIKYL